MTDVELTEVATLSPAGKEATGRRWKARLIEGDKVGSTAMYPADVLATQGPKIFKKGTPIFLDHASPEERDRNPHGSVKNFAGELAEDAYYDNDGLYAEIEVFENHAPMIKALSEKIGMSIRATGRTETRVIDGRVVPVVKEFKRARSVDFVVKAGAGGKLVQLLESAQTDESIGSEQDRENIVMDEATKELIEGLKADSAANAAALGKIADAFEKRFAVAEVEESAVDPLAVAKALADSELSESGRERAYELHKATGKDITELIEAEKAYEAKFTKSLEESAGTEEQEEDLEEGADSELTESYVPAQWKKASK